MDGIAFTNQYFKHNALLEYSKSILLETLILETLQYISNLILEFSKPKWNVWKTFLEHELVSQARIPPDKLLTSAG